MMAYQYMNSQKYREAIAIGEKYAKSDPRSSQAAATAVYVLQSYAEMVSKEAGADKPPAELPVDRKALLDFATYMEKTWPKEPAGDMARYQLALIYINTPVSTDDPDAAKAARTDNVHKAIEALGQVTPSYGQYTVTQYQLAQFCFGADKEKLAPMPGDGDDGYRKRALAALRSIPPLAAGSDPLTSRAYFYAKGTLAKEDFADKNFDEMEQLSQTLLPALPAAVLDADEAKNKAMHEEFEASIKGFQLYARWAKADVEARAADKADAKEKPAHYAKVLELLDPIINDIAAGQHPELQNNQPLAHGVLDNALRATIQLNKLNRTQVVLNGYKVLAVGGAADAGSAEVLKELVAFIPPQLEELKHKGDAAALEAAEEEIRRDPGRHAEAAAGRQADAGAGAVHRHPVLQPGPTQGRGRAAGQDRGAGLRRAGRRPEDVPGGPRAAGARAAAQRRPARGCRGHDRDPRRREEAGLGAEGDPGPDGEHRADGRGGRQQVGRRAGQRLGPEAAAEHRIQPPPQGALPSMRLSDGGKRLPSGEKLKAKNAAKFAEGVKAAANMAVELAKKQLGFVNDATLQPLPRSVRRPERRAGAEGRLPRRLPDGRGDDGEAGRGGAGGQRAARPAEARPGLRGRGGAGRGPGKDVAGLRRRRGHGPRDRAARQRRAEGGV